MRATVRPAWSEGLSQGVEHITTDNASVVSSIIVSNMADEQNPELLVTPIMWIMN